MDIINDLRAVKVSGISDSEIARRTGIPQATIWRLLNESSASPSYRTIKKLWPFLYGDRRPSPAPDAPAPAHPAWIVSTPGVGLTCTACDTVAEGITLDSPEGRQFVADHAGHEDPYPAMRKGQPAEAGVGA